RIFAEVVQPARQRRRRGGPELVSTRRRQLCRFNQMLEKRLPIGLIGIFGRMREMHSIPLDAQADEQVLP
ncbi:MAG TPA: hypothetical protein VGC77_11675, partial [Rhodopseudomonas sp.]